jgi:hypothetical protein
MNRFETGQPKRFPPEIEELIAEYGSLRSIPIEREYDTSAGRRVVRLTVQQWMEAFCPEDPDEVPEDVFEETAVNFILGRGHGQ